MTINNITNASKIMLGSQEIEKLYIGSTVLYQKSSSTPSESFFCKLELTDGTIVDLEGSGELTKEMVATPYASTLYKIHVGNLCTSIGDSAVFGCKQLFEVIIDEGVTTIGGGAFNGDGKLTVIDLPSTLTSIGAYSFHNMGTGVNTVIIRAATPPSIGNNNLFDSANTTIYVPDSSLSAYQTAWSRWATRIKALSTYHYYELPSGYTKLEYISSTATGGQYIETNLNMWSVMPVEYEIDMRVNMLGKGKDNNNQAVIFGNNQEVKPWPGFVIRKEGGDHIEQDQFPKVSSYGSLGEILNIHQLYTVNETAHNVTATLFCGKNSNGTPFRYSMTRLYYCKLRANSSTWQRDFVPCLNPDGIAGLYDKVEGKFYSSPNGVAFEYGEAI